MSRFPKITETFVLYEILDAESRGVQVEVFPLQREKQAKVHREAEEVVARAHFTPWISLAIVLANLQFLFRKPGKYLHALSTVIWANLGSFNYLAGGILYFPKAAYMASQMQKLNVRHIHAHFCNHPAAVAFVIHQLTGIAYSFTAHGTDLHCDRHMLREKVNDASSVITISQYNRDLIIDECGDSYANKVHVIHCGIDASKFCLRQSPTDFEENRGPMSILCIGTLHEVKGQRYLLEACRELKTRGIPFRCRLVGDGRDRRMLEKLVADLGIDDSVEFCGMQTRDGVRAILASADVLVVPSVRTKSGQREGIPVVLMEAMSSGVPCIGSDLSGIPELLGDNCGLLTTPRDSLAIAEALQQIHDDDDLRKSLVTNALCRIRDEFDLSTNTRELAKHFSVTYDSA